ncbi:hypothetical protein BaRGS_00003202 [Batillaria attramentaria]|uniref:Uncharacterized protein n=1 Tax=Batillaria attramentaria TaxID=370345 RepID=A0ABD0M167_9CAEN
MRTSEAMTSRVDDDTRWTCLDAKRTSSARYGNGFGSKGDFGLYCCFISRGLPEGTALWRNYRLRDVFRACGWEIRPRMTGERRKMAFDSNWGIFGIRVLHARPLTILKFVARGTRIATPHYGQTLRRGFIVFVDDFVDQLSTLPLIRPI